MFTPSKWTVYEAGWPPGPSAPTTSASPPSWRSWDPLSAEYPNLVLIQVWDQRSQEHSAATSTVA